MCDQERSYQAERLNLLRTQVAFAVEADTIATGRTPFLEFVNSITQDCPEELGVVSLLGMSCSQ
jgi:hypothetical protein